MATTRNSTILVTGGNRGIGRALVDEALRRGAARVYAGTRAPWRHPDERVVPLTLDVTDLVQIAAAVERVEALDVLINNAGVFAPDDLSDPAALQQHLAVNLFGMLGVTQAFRPALAAAKGAVINNLSLNALAPLPATPAYGVSKAAALSLTQSLRMQLAGQGVSVHAVLTGPTDTDMVRDLPIPKAAPASVARAILDGFEAGEEEIFPDPMALTLAEAWRAGPTKAFERQMAALA